MKILPLNHEGFVSYRNVRVLDWNGNPFEFYSRKEETVKQSNYWKKSDRGRFMLVGPSSRFMSFEMSCRLNVITLWMRRAPRMLRKRTYSWAKTI